MKTIFFLLTLWQLNVLATETTYPKEPIFIQDLVGAYEGGHSGSQSNCRVDIVKSEEGKFDISISTRDSSSNWQILKKHQLRKTIKRGEQHSLYLDQSIFQFNAVYPWHDGVHHYKEVTRINGQVDASGKNRLFLVILSYDKAENGKIYGGPVEDKSYICNGLEKVDN